jgi:hypothetical protein
LQHRRTTLPETQLQPYLSEYDTLTTLDHEAAAVAKQAAQRRADRERQLAEEEAQAAWDHAQHQESAAVQALRTSAPYQTTLQRVAELIVQHLPLAEFKVQLAQVPLPPQLKKLVNSYQLGVMATEFDRQHQITATRLQIVPRYLVADVDRLSRQLAHQRQRDWDDDLFNAAVGFDWTRDQRQARLDQLRQPWEGRQVPAAVFKDCLTIRERLSAGQPVPATWPAALRRAFAQRLAVQPQTGWVPAKKNHVTTAQLRQLAHSHPDFPAVATAYHRLYALPAATEAATLSALQQYYLLLADKRAERQNVTHALVQKLLED